MAGRVCSLSRPSEAFKLSLYPDERVKEDGVSSSVTFTASVEHIAGIDEHKIGGQLALGGYKKWEVALIDFCMPNNLETFQSIDLTTNRSMAILEMKMEYILNGSKGSHTFKPHYLPHSKWSIPSVVKHINAVIKSMWLEICPPLKGVNAGGDFFLQHFCKLVIDFIKVYSYPHDDHKLEFAKLVHTGVGDYKIDRITLWFSKALLSYLGNFNFKDSHFDQIPSGLIFYGQTLDKVVWQYPHLEFISTSQSYVPILTTVFVK